MIRKFLGALSITALLLASQPSTTQAYVLQTDFNLPNSQLQNTYLYVCWTQAIHTIGGVGSIREFLNHRFGQILEGFNIPTSADDAVCNDAPAGITAIWFATYDYGYGSCHDNPNTPSLGIWAVTSQYDSNTVKININKRCLMHWGNHGFFFWGPKEDPVPANRMSMISILAHEVGHALSQDHTNDSFNYNLMDAVKPNGTTQHSSLYECSTDWQGYASAMPWWGKRLHHIDTDTVNGIHAYYSGDKNGFDWPNNVQCEE